MAFGYNKTCIHPSLKIEFRDCNAWYQNRQEIQKKHIDDDRKKSDGNDIYRKTDDIENWAKN